jgi:hypothetical protein
VDRLFIFLDSRFRVCPRITLIKTMGSLLKGLDV